MYRQLLLVIIFIILGANLVACNTVDEKSLIDSKGNTEEAFVTDGTMLYAASKLGIRIAVGSRTSKPSMFVLGIFYL